MAQKAKGAPAAPPRKPRKPRAPPRASEPILKVEAPTLVSVLAQLDILRQRALAHAGAARLAADRLAGGEDPLRHAGIAGDGDPGAANRDETWHAGVVPRLAYELRRVSAILDAAEHQLARINRAIG
jgi:hypothetical protein